MERVQNKQGGMGQGGEWRCHQEGCEVKSGGRYHVLDGTGGYAPNVKALCAACADTDAFKGKCAEDKSWRRNKGYVLKERPGLQGDALYTAAAKAILEKRAKSARRQSGAQAAAQQQQQAADPQAVIVGVKRNATESAQLHERLQKVQREKADASERADDHEETAKYLALEVDSRQSYEDVLKGHITQLGGQPLGYREFRAQRRP